MVIKIGHKKFIKPRRCPECGRLAIMATWWTSERCKECHERRDRRKKNIKSHKKYNRKYQKARKATIEAHPYCALCGATHTLTTHHVGGGVRHTQYDSTMLRMPPSLRKMARKETINTKKMEET